VNNLLELFQCDTVYYIHSVRFLWWCWRAEVNDATFLERATFAALRCISRKDNIPWLASILCFDAVSWITAKAFLCKKLL